MALTKITSRILDSSGVTILGTIATGVWQGTAINQTYLVGQSGTNTGDETLARINALDVTELGTVSSGVWNGTAIASAYLDADTAHLSTTQTFTGAKTFSDNVLINKASNPTSLQIGSSLADDPFVVFQTDGNTMSMGIDRGDSNKFKISDNATLGTNDRLTITTGGLATFSGDVKVNEVNPLIFVDSTSTNKASGIITSESGTNKWAIGTNFGSSDNSFNIYNYTAASRYLTISSGGDATFSGAATFTKDQNADTSIKLFNPNTGTSTEATIYVTNSSANANGLFLGTTGVNTTTAGGFVQDGSHIGSGSGASGGLSIMTRAAADIRFYTNGHTNERMRITSGGNVDFKSHISINSASGAAGAQGGITINQSPQNSASRNWKIWSDDAAWGDFNIKVATAYNGSTYTTPLNISSGGDATFAKSIKFADGAAFAGAASIRQQSNALILTGGSSGFFFNDDTNAVSNLAIASNGNATFQSNANKLTINSTNSTQATIEIGRSVDTKAKITSGDVSSNDFNIYTAGSRKLSIGSNWTSTLDAYEEGTWDPTPGRTGGTQPNVSAYAYREGTFVKVGKLVTVMWDFAATITSQGSTAAISIKGLPFAVGTSIANGGKMAGYGVVQFRSGSLYVNTTAQRSLTGFVQQGASYIYVESQKMGTDGFGSAGSVNNYLLNVSSARSTGTCTYFTN